MGRTGGCKNGQFNGRQRSWQHRAKIKSKVVRKRLGTREEHADRVKAQSKSNSAKHRRRVEHAKKMTEMAKQEKAGALAQTSTAMDTAPSGVEAMQE